ncbi:MAG TPA: hypothetical protein VMM58_11375 [Bacteroidota bacterium]|nr:hypothetical protein [Bacteroidota bacterium]
MNRSFTNLLLRSLDVPLPEKDRRTLEEALRNSPELRAAHTEFMDLRSALRSTGHESLNPFFAERVMERLRHPRVSIEEFYLSVFRFIAAAAAVVVIVCGAYNLSRADALGFDSVFGFHHPTFQQVLTLEAPFE